MKKKLWIAGGTVAGLIIIGAVGLAGFSIYTFMVLANMANGDPYRATEVHEYAEEKIGRQIEITKRTKDIGNPKYSQVMTARTLDRQGVSFLIYVKRNGEIAYSNFEEISPGYEVTDKYAHSKPFRELEKRGFRLMTIGSGPYEDDISMHLPEGIYLSDEEAGAIIFEALPVLRELSVQVDEDTGYPLEKVVINGKEFDLNRNYSRPEEIDAYLSEGMPE